MGFEGDIGGAALDGVFPHDFATGGRRARADQARAPRERLRAGGLLALCLLSGVMISRTWNKASVIAPNATAPQVARFSADERLAPLAVFAGRDEDQAPTRYVARVNVATGERRDSLTWGEAEAGLLFRVALHSGPLPQARSSLFVALATQSAELGAAVVHATTPQRYETAQGAIEWADMTLSDRNGERPCVGFRTIQPLNVDLSGFACAGRGASMDRASLECLIDQLTPTDAGIAAGWGEILTSDPNRTKACPRRVG